MLHDVTIVSDHNIKLSLYGLPQSTYDQIMNAKIANRVTLIPDVHGGKHMVDMSKVFMITLDNRY